MLEMSAQIRAGGFLCEGEDLSREGFSEALLPFVLQEKPNAGGREQKFG